MRIRVALALSLAAPAAVVWFVAGANPGAVAGAWWVPAVAGLVALVWLGVLRRSAVLLLVAGGLSILGTQAAAKARVMLDVSTDVTTEGAFPFHDLRDGGIPEPVPPYIRIRGYVRSGWTLDEYAVERGGLPDQSQAPIAVLIPVTGSPPPEAPEGGEGEGAEGAERNPIQPGDAVVVVRVAPNAAFERRTPATLQGKIEPLDPELLGTLVQVEGDGEGLRGVLVNTLAVPTRKDAWVELGLAAIALVVAMACGFVAAAPREDA